MKDDSQFFGYSSEVEQGPLPKVEKTGGRIHAEGENQELCFGQVRFKVTISYPSEDAK